MAAIKAYKDVMRNKYNIWGGFSALSVTHKALDLRCMCPSGLPDALIITQMTQQSLVPTETGGSTLNNVLKIMIQKYPN